MGRKKPQGPTTYEWKSPVSFNARSMATVIRKILDKKGFSYKRRKGERPYSRFMVLMPMPKFAYVYKFVIEEPVQLTIHTWDERPTHSGLMPWMEITDITDENAEVVKEILREIHEALPRPAWEFTMGQKLQYALVSGEYRQAKKAWKSMGFRTGKKK